MANNRLSMRKITEVLRLYFEHGRSKREIARIIGASPTTITVHGRSRLAKLSIGANVKVKIASVHSDFVCGICRCP